MTERDWSVIHYNEHLTLHDIPARVGLQPALKSVRNDQFQRHDRRTGIVSDDNLCCPNPRYTLDLFGKVVRVTITTLDLMEKIPPLGRI